MAQPDFLVIGAQKAGTTWLDVMFRSHPDIWTPVVKELQFFNELHMSKTFGWTKKHRENHAAKVIRSVLNSDQVDWSKIDQALYIAREPISYEWYEKVFSYAPINAVKGEITPEYSLLNETHLRDIAMRYPELKIILVIREPLARALSGIKMRLDQMGFNEGSSQSEIDQFVIEAALNWDVIERGNYKKIIDNINNEFNKNNIKIYLSDDLNNNSRLVLSDIGKFLNVDHRKFAANPERKIHVGKNYHVSKKAVELVAEHQKDNIAWFEENYSKYLLE